MRTEPPELGYMIERSARIPQWWKGDSLNVSDDAAWTTDPNNAVVFGSSTSALVVLMTLGRNCRKHFSKSFGADSARVTEHMWPRLSDSASDGK